MRAAGRTITLITHVQSEYIHNDNLPIQRNCQRLANHPLAGRVIEQQAAELPPWLTHSGRVIKQIGADYSLGELETDSVILAGGSMLLPDQYYPEDIYRSRGLCQYHAFHDLIDNLKLGENAPGRPVNIHFPADVLYYCGVDRSESLMDPEFITEFPPIAPNVLEHYEGVLNQKGVHFEFNFLGQSLRSAEQPRIVLNFWRSVDELFHFLASGQEIRG